MSLSENANIFVGRGFRYDIKLGISVSALAPEALKRSCHADSRMHPPEPEQVVSPLS
jgi:hypothetical protein